MLDKVRVGMAMTIGALLIVVLFLGTSFYTLYNKYSDSLDSNSTLAKGILDKTQQLNEMTELNLEITAQNKKMVAIVEAQNHRNENIEIEYMKQLFDNKESATPHEKIYLEYLLKIYQLDEETP